MNKEEIDNLSVVARDIRPKDLDNDRLLSSTDLKDIIHIFIISYDFLSVLSSKVKDEALKGKIDSIINKSREVYSKLLPLYIEINNEDTEYSKVYVSEEISEILKKDYERIYDFIHTSISIGKKSKVYDPDKYGGVMDEG